MRTLSLSHFAATRPHREIPQAQILAWLAEAHADAEQTRKGLDAAARDDFALRMRNVIGRCAAGPDKIATRGFALDEITDRAHSAIYDLHASPHGAGTAQRNRRYDEAVGAYFTSAYADDATAPDDLVHVTCTGYASPSAAQRMVAERGWPTRVTHAYHMGCYASLPAVRIAAGLTCAFGGRVDLVHTELCSLHLDPGDHGLEQLVVQSLFADGFIRYTMTTEAVGLRLLALHEAILPDSTQSMTWVLGDAGMHMTLARDVPERIAGALDGFVTELFTRGQRARDGAIWAVHPGGPKIIDRVRDVLHLDEAQVAASRGVLYDYGNMSSATLPHIWMRILDDDTVAPGTAVASLAFGPGLTVCGALFEKQ
jgi:predicted naringenin-chalcone synthase